MRNTIPTWIVCVVSLLIGAGTALWLIDSTGKHKAAELTQALEKKNLEIAVVGTAMMKLRDENKTLKTRHRIETFAVLGPNLTRLEFSGFKGSLLWFTQDPSGNPPSFNLLGDSVSPEAIEDVKEGFVIPVPQGARGYLLRGAATSSAGYTIDVFFK